MKLQRKIFQASMALSHFTSNNWYFINTNFLNLLKCIPEKDREAFDFSFQNVDPEHYLNEAILGGHQYLLHTDIATLPAAVRRYKKYVNLYVKCINYRFYSSRKTKKIQLEKSDMRNNTNNGVRYVDCGELCT